MRDIDKMSILKNFTFTSLVYLQAQEVGFRSITNNLGRVHFLLRFFSPSQIHLRFKTEKPSQLLLKCEKVCILKSP